MFRKLAASLLPFLFVGLTPVLAAPASAATNHDFDGVCINWLDGATKQVCSSMVMYPHQDHSVYKDQPVAELQCYDINSDPRAISCSRWKVMADPEISANEIQPPYNRMSAVGQCMVFAGVYPPQPIYGFSEFDRDCDGIRNRLDETMPANTIQRLKLAGGDGAVPAGSAAVAINVTVDQTGDGGFATVYPCDQPVPEASNLNFRKGDTVANLVIAKPAAADGAVCFATSAGTDLIVDLSGYFPPTSDFKTIPNPTRILDTRNGLGAPTGKVAAGQVLTVQVAGHGGTPVDLSAAALNITVDNADADGFLTAFPCDQSRPTASNLNYIVGKTVPNLVIAKPSPSGTVCLYSSATAHLLVDVSGYFPAGSTYTPVANPTRIVDTREGLGVSAVGPVGVKSTLQIPMWSANGIPNSVPSVAINVTMANARGGGFVTVYPCASGLPEASNVNAGSGATVANSVIASPDDTGKVCLYSENATDLIVDVAGYFAPHSQNYVSLPSPYRAYDTRRSNVRRPTDLCHFLRNCAIAFQPIAG